MDHSLNQFINKIYNKAVPEALQSIPNDCIDLTLTSPPFYDDKIYILDNGSDEFGWKSYDEYLIHLKEVFKEIYRVSKPGARCVLILSNSPKTDKNDRIVEYWPCIHDTITICRSLGWKLQDEAVWAKVNPSYDDIFYPKSPETQLIPHHDWISILRKPGDYSKVKGVKYESSSIWELPNEGISEDYNHSYSSFPELLVEKCIKYWTIENSVILDPYAGSGQTIKSAIDWNRRGIGFEIDPKWVSLWDDINNQE